MTESIFTGFTSPANTNALDGDTKYTLATRFHTTANGVVNAISWWFPDELPGVTVPGMLWNDDTGALLVSKNFVSPSSGVSSVVLDTPIAITAGVNYKVGIWTDRYVFRGSVFGTITSGHLVADGGYFDSSGSPTRPTGGGTSAYYADVVADFSTTVTGTATGSMGGLTGAANGKRIVNGVASGVLGGLSGAGTGKRIVSGTGTANLGGLTMSATGRRTVSGAAAGPLGALTGAGSGRRTVSGSATGPLGGLAGVGLSEHGILPGQVTITASHSPMAITANHSGMTIEVT